MIRKIQEDTYRSVHIYSQPLSKIITQTNQNLGRSSQLVVVCIKNKNQCIGYRLQTNKVERRSSYEKKTFSKTANRQYFYLLQQLPVSNVKNNDKFGAAKIKLMVFSLQNSNAFVPWHTYCFLLSTRSSLDFFNHLLTMKKGTNLLNWAQQPQINNKLSDSGESIVFLDGINGLVLN